MWPHSPPSPLLAPRLSRLRHFKPHRAITVQLLADIPGLGNLGTVQHVAPGYMRNTLFPLRKARYLNDGPQLLQDGTQAIDDLVNKLRNLPEILFERNARSTHLSPGKTETLLYHPITMQAIADHLRDTYDIKHLHPPHAVLESRSNAKDRLSWTGPHLVDVLLSTGESLPIQIRVHRKFYGEKTV